MGRIGEQLDIDFVVSTGDNFYGDGLRDVNDPAFLESFKDIYTATSLQKQWYSGKFINKIPLILCNFITFVSIKDLCIYGSYLCSFRKP